MIITLRNNATRKELVFKGIKYMNTLRYKYELVSILGSSMTFSKTEYALISEKEDEKVEQ